MVDTRPPDHYQEVTPSVPQKSIRLRPGPFPSSSRFSMINDHQEEKRDIEKDEEVIEKENQLSGLNVSSFLSDLTFDG